MARLGPNKAPSASRTRLVRAASSGASLGSAAGAWAMGRPGMAIFLLVTVHLAIPLCNLLVRNIATPITRGAARALEPGIEGVVERFFLRCEVRANRRLSAIQSHYQPKQPKRELRIEPIRRLKQHLASTEPSPEARDVMQPMPNDPASDASTSEEPSLGRVVRTAESFRWVNRSWIAQQAPQN